MRPDLFLPSELFKDRMDELNAILKSQPTAEGHEEVLMPGEPESRASQQRQRWGVPLQADVVEALKEEGRRIGVEFPGPMAVEKRGAGGA